MSRKVEEQKGPINAAEKTSKMNTFGEKVKKTREENALRRSAQTLTLHQPKQK